MTAPVAAASMDSVSDTTIHAIDAVATAYATIDSATADAPVR